IAMQLEPDETYLSPIMPAMSTDISFKPSIHVAQPVFGSDGTNKGLIVLYHSFSRTFSVIDVEESSDPGVIKPILVCLDRNHEIIQGQKPGNLKDFSKEIILINQIEIARRGIVTANSNLEPLSIKANDAVGPCLASYLTEDTVQRFIHRNDSTYANTALVLTLVNLFIAFFLGKFQARQSRYGQAMRDEKERFQSLYHGVSDAVMVCQIKAGERLGRFIEVNDVACRQLGYTTEEFTQMTLRDITASDCDVEIWRIHIDSSVAFQQKRVSCDRKELWVETRVHRLKYGSTRAIMFLDHDVTNLRSTVQQLKKAKTQAESANHAKSAFLANMSHEIRTPMNAILGYTQLLRRDKSLNVIAREHLEIIHRSGEHLLALINDVLELSKIEAGRVQVTNELFDMKRLMTDMDRMFQLRVKQKGLCFAMESSWDVKDSIQADQGKIRQILINMLGNAVKFTEKGGIIFRYGSKTITKNKIKVWVEVEDTGRGISPEEISKVFQPFEQASSGIAQGGTGLGMSISRESARVMGGDITVVSKAGKGSIFRLEFPAESSAITPDDFLDHTTVIRLVIDREYTILVVDDSEHNRRLLQTLLKNSGFKVVTASDGLDAVETFKQKTPNLVLMDLKMPAMNGDEAARLIRLLPGGSSVPILLVTANTSDACLPEDLAELFQTVIRKPFKDTEILSSIRDALRLDYKYEYEPKIPSAIFSTTQMKVSSRIIPMGTRLEMHQAVRDGDMDRFEILTDELALEHPLMAARLKQYAEEFDYDKLILILENQEKQV
ncbi:response regulator, partial [bacterium]|nr:response regulator [bacterium]